MIVFLVVCSAFFFVSPFAVLISTCLAAVVAPTKDFRWMFLVGSCVLFTTLNVSKQLDGDLVNYVNLQDYLSAKPFSTLFDEVELGNVSGSYRSTEIGFYATLWWLSRLFADSKLAISILATLGIYLPTFFGILIIGNRERWGNGLILTCAAFAFFASINFVQTTHLLRQYMSSAFVFLAFGLYLADRTRTATLFAVYACLIHNATILLAADIFILSRLFPFEKSSRSNFFSLFFRLSLALPLIGASIVFASFHEGENLGPDDLSISLWHYGLVGGFYLIYALAVKVSGVRLKSLHYFNLAFLVIYSLSLGFFIAGLKLYALRYFAYLEWLFGPLVAGILYAFSRHPSRLAVFFRFATTVAAAGILIFRIRGSPWDYGPGPNEFLTWDFFEVIHLVGR